MKYKISDQMSILTSATDHVLHPVYLVQVNGNFYGAASLTLDLAKLKYMRRQTMLLQAFVKQVGGKEELIQ